jgi:serine/threonine protein kinase
MYQLACGINYLHKYGVLHRDLKPENIMLTECSDKGVIKVMDFGLSKIMGPGEKVADGFGTLSFVAPEVLIRQPYNKQIDIWSLGVILYFMLSGTLPFDDENDNEEVIAKMTVFVEVQFPSKYWSKKSPQVIDLISKCLIKDPNKRIAIEDFLQHEWIKKYNQ